MNRSTTVLVNCLLALVTQVATAQTGPEVVASVAAKAVSERSAKLSAETPLIVETRAGKYSMTKGTAWEIVTAKGVLIGYFFRGDGLLRWKRSPAILSAGQPSGQADELSRQIAKILRTDDDGAEFRFHSASFLFGGQSPAKVPGPAWGPEKPPSDVLAKHLRRFDSPFLLPVDLSVATAMIDKERGFFAAHLEGKRDLVHYEDGVFSGEASLSVVSPGAPPVVLDSWRMTDRPSFSVSSVELDVRELERGHGLGLFKVTERIRLEEPSSVLVFALLSDPPFTPAPVFFDSLAEEALSDMPFYLKNGRLFVFLPDRMPEGASLTLKMRYQGGLLERYEKDRLGWELPGHQAWYPRPFRWEASHATWRGVLRSRKPSVPLAPGEDVRRWVDGSWNALEFKVPEARPSLSLLAGCYSSRTAETAEERAPEKFYSWLDKKGPPERTGTGVLPRVTVQSFCGASDLWEASTADLVQRITAASESLFGPYPYQQLRVVERDGTVDVMDSQNWGLSPGNLIPARKSPSPSEAFRLAGRILQGPWTDQIRLRRRQDTWLAVSLANISALEVLQQVAPDINTGLLVHAAREKSFKLLAEFRKTPAAVLSEMGDPEMKGEIKSRVTAAVALGPDAPDGLNAPKAPLSRGHALASHSLGLVLMDSIRKRMGTDKFLAFLKSFYLERKKAGEMGTEDLIDSLSKATDEEWYPWFERYLYGNEIPPAQTGGSAVSPTPGTARP